MNNEQQSTALAVVDIDGARAVGEVFYKSGFFADVKSEAQAMVKVLAGQELGVPPFASIQGIEIVEGKLSIKPVLMAALIRKSGRYDYSVLVSDADRAEVAFYALDRRGETDSKRYLGSSVYTMDMARTAGLAGKLNWTRRPVEMLYWRSMSAGCRKYCPDIFIGGVYVEGENDDRVSYEPPAPTPRDNSGDVGRDYVERLVEATTADRPNIVEDASYSVVPTPTDPNPPTALPEPIRASEPTNPPEPVELPPPSTPSPDKDPSRLRVTAQMARNMLSLAENNRFTAESLGEWIGLRGFKSSASITRADYPSLLEALESGAAFAEWQSENSRKRAAEIVARGISTETDTNGESPLFG